EESVAAVAFVAAIVCIGLAEAAVRAGRCYRFGVEEALAVGAVVLCAVGAALLISQHAGPRSSAQAGALMAGTAGGFALFARFGLVYAAVGAMACVALVPFVLDMPPLLQHAVAAAALAAI